MCTRGCQQFMRVFFGGELERGKILCSSHKWVDGDSPLWPVTSPPGCSHEQLAKPILTNTVQSHVAFTWTFIFIQWAFCLFGLYNNKNRSWSRLESRYIIYITTLHTFTELFILISYQISKRDTNHNCVNKQWPFQNRSHVYINWIQCSISEDYSIKVGTNIRNIVGTLWIWENSRNVILWCDSVVRTWLYQPSLWSCW